MRKPYICLNEKQGADKLLSNCDADQLLCFATQIYNSSSTYNQNFKPLACFCDFTCRFLSHLVRNPDDRFFRIAAQLICVESSFSH